MSKRVPRKIALFLLRLAKAAHRSLNGLALLTLLLAERDFFDRDFYRSRYQKGAFQQRFPLLHFAFAGAERLRKPNLWFSQRKHRLNISLDERRSPVLVYLLTPRAKRQPKRPGGEGTSKAPPTPDSISAQTSTRANADRFAELWPLIRADLAGLENVTSQLSPTVDLEERLKEQRILPRPLKTGAIVRSVLDALPTDVAHLLVLPWFGMTGGSERITQHLLRFLREFYPSGGLCMFSPDALADLKPGDRGHLGVPSVAINDFVSQLDLPARVEIFDRVMVELRPATVHSVNSLPAWLAFMDRGHFYAQDSKLFGNIYSDIRIQEGKPVGYFWQSLPYTIESMAGVIADNRAVLDRANENFGLTAEYRARCHVVPTPVVGLNGDPGSDLRPCKPVATKHSLWMSRIAQEKRLEVLRDLARLCPDRQFSMYGVTLAAGLPVDLSWVAEASNVTLYGQFGQLGDLPFEQFDSYVFTTSAEGMPISVLEIAMVGLPIVAPAIGGIGEFIDDETGWLVSAKADPSEYAAALDEIHRNPEEARRRVARAQQRLLERHSWAEYRRRMSAIPGYLNRRPG